ncbi:DNA repair protein RAD50 [Apiospora rasikravindrae]|uniref:DNA repair protein RAD50 n=1 Tax=Apiospora rasikravindrae TaxID=990691 RepID=A0ABR1RX49_9PEZI
MALTSDEAQKDGIAAASAVNSSNNKTDSAVTGAPTTSSSSQANMVGSDSTTTDEEPPAFHPTLQFWLAFLALLLATLLSALDGAIVATALPTISSDLDVGPDFVWVANVYFLTGAVLQPLFGQLSDLWGRRPIFIAILAVFTLGSGLCGGASSGQMLIAARAVQGIGAGGINMMVDLILCDLVPMRERGKYLGILFGVIGLFSAVGPLIGGALAQSGQWRWAFYLNLPIGGVCILITVFFMKLQSRVGGGFAQKLRRVDWVGVTILTISCIAIMYAVTYGGASRPWSDASIATPLTGGLLGLIGFALFEGTPFVSEPVTPYHLFANRTSAIAFVVTFLQSMMGLYMIYVYALYFQAVLGANQTLSGVYLIPTAISFPLFSAVGGALMTRFGRYKPLHLIGFAFLTLGCGLSSLLGPDSSPAAWVFFQLFLGIGAGLTMAVLLPAVQAQLPESDTALSTGTWAFIRSLGVIWAVTIPAAIFNNRFGQLLHIIDDPAARAMLDHGNAYSHGTAALVDSFGGATTAQVRDVYSRSIQRVWQIGVVFSGVCFLLALLEKETRLRQELETDFGLQGEKEKGKETQAEP